MDITPPKLAFSALARDILVVSMPTAKATVAAVKLAGGQSTEPSVDDPLNSVETTTFVALATDWAAVSPNCTPAKGDAVDVAAGGYYVVRRSYFVGASLFIECAANTCR